MMPKGEARSIEQRGSAERTCLDAVDIRDPHGYVVERTARPTKHHRATDPARREARPNLDARPRAEASPPG